MKIIDFLKSNFWILMIIVIAIFFIIAIIFHLTIPIPEPSPIEPDHMTPFGG